MSIASPPGLAVLRENAWPRRRPVVDIPQTGWFGKGNRALLGAYLGSDTRVVVELGSWLGTSTRYLLEAAPNATVITVDHWQGSPEINVDPAAAAILPKLYDAFLMHLWSHRDRLIPLRADTMEGLRRIAAAGVVPDLVYVDADHSKEAVREQLAFLHDHWPDARIVGDDWTRPSVRAAVRAHAERTGQKVIGLRNAWTWKRPEDRSTLLSIRRAARAAGLWTEHRAWRTWHRLRGH